MLQDFFLLLASSLVLKTRWTLLSSLSLLPAVSKQGKIARPSLAILLIIHMIYICIHIHTLHNQWPMTSFDRSHDFLGLLGWLVPLPWALGWPAISPHQEPTWLKILFCIFFYMLSWSKMSSFDFPFLFSSTNLFSLGLKLITLNHT